jgi:GT2 family glycosyltransferase
MPGVNPDVAILIVTYNSAEFLAGLFGSLREHTALERIPVIVVDNASTDGTREALAALAASGDVPMLHVLEQTENTGFARGNNIGLAFARTLGVRYVQLLNPDTVVRRGWLTRPLAVMEARPTIAAAQPLLTLYEDPERVNSAGNAIHFCGFTYCGGYRKHRDDVLADGDVVSVPYATGAALLLRLSALDVAGDFDERLFLYHEDCDLQLRLRQSGYDCVRVASAEVSHKYKASFSSAKYGWLERNRWLVMVKCWPMAAVLAALPVLLFVELAVLAFAFQAGWWQRKMWSYREVIRLLPDMLASRRAVQARRRGNATDLPWFTAAIVFEGLDHFILTRIANPALTVYWNVMCRLLARTPPHPTFGTVLDAFELPAPADEPAPAVVVERAR